MRGKVMASSNHLARGRRLVGGRETAGDLRRTFSKWKANDRQRKGHGRIPCSDY
jgi:hypothetical protein